MPKAKQFIGRHIGKLILILLLAGCLALWPRYEPLEPDTTPLRAYRHVADRFVAATGHKLPNHPYPCGMTLEGGYSIPRPIADCVYMEPARRWEGLWAGFGGTFLFCPGSECNFSNRKWKLIYTGEPRTRCPGSAYYSVASIGRRTAFGSGEPGFEHALVVDRMLSTRRVRQVDKSVLECP